MSKLMINECAKLFRRPGTLVMLGIVVLIVLGLGAYIKYDETQNPPVQQTTWKQELGVQLEADKAALSQSGANNAGLRMHYEREIAVKEYQLENGIAPVSTKNVWSFVEESMGTIGIIAVFVIIVAAGMVSSEFSWGTIKLLLIRPISRSKILLSKYLTVLLFAGLLLTLLYIVSAIVGFALFGLPDQQIPHLAFVDGEVIERSMVLQLMGEYLLSSIDMLMVATMAFMISAVFRNSSLAIGLSLFVMFTGGTVTMVIASKFEWAKYILFANTDLSVYFDGVPMVEGMTLAFSIFILLTYFAVFHILAFYVFSKRDVAA